MKIFIQISQVKIWKQSYQYYPNKILCLANHHVLTLLTLKKEVMVGKYISNNNV